MMMLMPFNESVITEDKKGKKKKNVIGRLQYITNPSMTTHTSG